MNGREAIITTVHQVLNSIFEHQMRAEARVIDNIRDWNNAYEQQNFELMESAYSNIRENLKMLMPLSEYLNEIGRIDNLHNLIRNNGNDFNISEYEQKTAELLVSPRFTTVFPRILDNMLQN